ncbi:MAG: PEGA domain-containing protein [Deltaproteobacteria bacterium]|nr:PEGA domain-containing protein [Deltaproteobacteria bacterium]
MLDLVLDALAQPRDEPVDPVPPYALPNLTRPRNRLLQRPGVTRIVRLLLVVCGASSLLALGWSVSGSDPPPALPAVSASIAVTSTPPGAEILVEGVPTGRFTPAELDEVGSVLGGASTPTESASDRRIMPGQSVEISVRHPDFVAHPASIVVHIPDDSLFQSAHFDLREAATFTLMSEPSGAFVEVDGVLQRGTTPLILQSVVVGDTREARVILDGHVARRVKLSATKSGPAMVSVALEPARLIEVQSEPSGADVYVDGELVGRTPTGSVAVPKQSCFRLRIARAGFREMTRRCPTTARLSVKLRELPLGALPMNPDQRARLAEIERSLRRDAARLAKVRTLLARSELALDRAAKRRHSFVTGIPQIQARIERHADRKEQLEGRVHDLRAEIDSLRHDLLLAQSIEP